MTIVTHIHNISGNLSHFDKGEVDTGVSTRYNQFGFMPKINETIKALKWLFLSKGKTTFCKNVLIPLGFDFKMFKIYQTGGLYEAGGVGHFGNVIHG